MSEKDGGSAFPELVSDNNCGNGPITYFSTGGMSLRDWFAGQALAGLLADSKFALNFADSAASAYGYADAMIAERGNRDGK